MKTVLITAANGMFGARAAEILASNPEVKLKLMLRDVSKCKISGPNVEICPADMDQPDTMDPYFAGVDNVFLVSPMDPRLNARETAMVELCRKHRIRQIVKMAGAVKHEDKLGALHTGVLTLIRDSGMDWALVSPNSVMETSLLSYNETIRLARCIVSCAGDGKIGLVALRDVAEVIAHVLSTEGHSGQNYEITGSRSYTLTGVAEVFSKVLGKEIVYLDLNEGQFGKMVMKNDQSMTPERLEMEILCHLRAWKGGCADVVTDTYKRLMNKEPTSLEEFVAENADYFKKGMKPAFIAKMIRKSFLE